MLQLFVKTLSGRSITVYANENDTVALLQYIICAREGIPPHQQRLFGAGCYPLERKLTKFRQRIK